MANSNSRGIEIPDHLWQLGLAVRSLIEQYEAMQSWRRHVRAWVKLVREAAEKPNYTGVDVMDLPLAPEIDEEYALLAAVHDNCASPERNEELIHPWAAKADFGGSEEVDLNSEELHGIAAYSLLMQHVLPGQGHRGIEQSKADRLLRILRHVANDLRNAARLWTPDRSICADDSVPDPVEEYASFLRRGSESEDVRVDLTQPNVQEADDLEASAIDGEQAKPVEEQQVTVDERGKETLDEQDTNESQGETDGDDAQSTDINQSSSDEETTQTATPKKLPPPNETEIEAKRIEERARSIMSEHGISPGRQVTAVQQSGFILKTWLDERLTAQKARDKWHEEYPHHRLPGDNLTMQANNVTSRIKQVEGIIQRFSKKSEQPL